MDLSLDDVRAVAAFAADCAELVLPGFEAAVPDDVRPREALDAARAFAGGGPRTLAQRTTAVAAHRAAKAAPTEVARLGAQACGDAAAAAYLHPLAQATQVGHVLRSAACAARVAELTGSGAGVAELAGRAGPRVRAVLLRYPTAPAGRSRPAQLVAELDAAVRDLPG
ncbi:putative immunity protein [Klenkia marina]|uniref:putative immunity protein n=1 Tax=Klenkia marina TaxID=1960309 RepID=UPI001FB25AF5|nr:exonuclease SbcC [Klenkia marina]